MFQDRNSSYDRSHSNQPKTFGALNGLKQFVFKFLASGITGQIQDIEAVEKKIKDYFRSKSTSTILE